jgi:hypothetical protein
MSNLPSYRMFIGGEWVAAESGEWFESFDLCVPKTSFGDDVDFRRLNSLFLS